MDFKLVRFFIVVPEWVKDFVHVMLLFICGHVAYDVAKVVMKFLYGVIIALVAMYLTGCSLHYPRSQIGFWDQCIKLNSYGFTMVTAYGPFNFGYLTYERNVNCESDIKQQKPLIPSILSSGWAVKEVTITVAPTDATDQSAYSPIRHDD